MSEERYGLKIVEWDEGLGFDYDNGLRATLRATFEIEELEEWWVQIIIEHEYGSTHVSGLAMIPRNPDNPPLGGLSTTELRKVPISSLLSHARRRIARELKVFKGTVSGILTFETGEPGSPSSSMRVTLNPSSALADEIQDTARSIITAKRPGSAGRSDYEYILLVVEYQNALTDGSKKPNHVVAAKYFLDHTTVRNMLQEARARGLAESAGPGRMGWKLTEKGQRILNRKGK
jgi:hypothetical protein